MRLGFVVVVLALGGCVEGTFTCVDDEDCGADGVCESGGSCSFSDESCPSGRRYGELAAGDVAGRCVADEAPSLEDDDCEMQASAGACPPGCPGACEDGVCHVACAAPGGCSDAEIVCPPGWPCAVACSGLAACARLRLQCGDAGCELACTGLGSCQDAALLCGAGPCDAVCSPVDAGPLAIECGDACACDRTCAL